MSLLSAIPTPYKLAGGAIAVALLLAALIGFYAWAHHEGAASCEAAVARAVAEAQAQDRTRSEQLLDAQGKALTALHAQASTYSQKVANEPVTSTCGPVQRDASHGVRDIIHSGAPAP